MYINSWEICIRLSMCLKHYSARNNEYEILGKALYERSGFRSLLKTVGKEGKAKMHV